MMIFKCSADQARGRPLSDDDDVYYLTWLIVYSEGAEDAPVIFDADWQLVDHRLKWNYEAPKNYANLIMVLVYVEPC
eukprot:6173419-Pyramimonas_sp.AAC.1